MAAQDRQGAGGQLVVTQLHQGVGLLLGTGALVTGAPPGLHHGFECGLQLLPTHRVQVEPAGLTDRATSSDSKSQVRRLSTDVREHVTASGAARVHRSCGGVTP